MTESDEKIQRTYWVPKDPGIAYLAGTVVGTVSALEEIMDNAHNVSVSIDVSRMRSMVDTLKQALELAEKNDRP